MNDGVLSAGQIVNRVMLGLLAFVLCVGLLFGMWTGIKVISRYQARADRNQHRTQARYDANNEVAINAIRIRTFQQKVKIAQQQAQIRFVNSTGIRKSQDEIAKTLTPLYVQFEMVQALQAIAQSGRNSSVIYLPSGSAGIPLIQGAGPSVGSPTQAHK